MSNYDERIQREKEHGKWLAENTPIETWGWGTPAGQERARRRAELIINGGGLASGKRVIEVGCGTGMFTERFCQSGAEILALDLAENLLDIAKKRDLPNVEFRLTPFEEIQCADGYDAIIGSSVLHHLDIDHSLPEAFRLLKTGGKLCFAEPNMLNPQVFLERRFRSLFPYVSADETAFIRFPLAKSLKLAGFSEISITPFDWLHPSTPQALIPMVDFAGRMFEKTPGVREFAGSLLIEATK